MRGRYSRGATGTEASRTHRRDGSSDMRIVDVRHIGESSAAMERGDSTIAINIRDINVGNIYASEAAAVSAPPREEAVTGPNRQPAEASPSAKTNTETYAYATAEAEE